MKFDDMPPAEILPNDPPEIKQAIGLLRDAGIEAKRPTRGQLKLDRTTSYYPVKGTLFEDGAPGREPLRGLPALKAWIEARSLTIQIDF